MQEKSFPRECTRRGPEIVYGSEKDVIRDGMFSWGPRRMICRVHKECLFPLELAMSNIVYNMERVLAERISKLQGGR